MTSDTPIPDMCPVPPVRKGVRLYNLWRNKDGTAAVEAAFLFPILITMFFGLWDLGNGMLMNQQTITASQVVGDLITRERTVDTTKLNNYIVAGQLAFGNAPTTSYGIDILSVKFGPTGQPTQLWRETRNMTPDTVALSKSAGLGSAGEGVVVVTVQYTYKPTFASIFTGAMVMREQAFLRGRRSPVVERI